MNISIAKAKLNKSEFVSLKYIEKNGNLSQIDFKLENFDKYYNSLILKGMNLQQISGKEFIDPFRSIATTNYFCDNLIDNQSCRKIASELYYNFKSDSVSENNTLNLFAEISFWVVDDRTDMYISGDNSQRSKIDHNYKADPIDCFANLRSDIIKILENIGIETTMHFHGNFANECVIGIAAKNIIDLGDNIIIAKFIISNVCASYAFSVNFSQNGRANLSIFLAKTKNYIDDLYSNLQSLNSEFCTNNVNNCYEFKILDCAKCDNVIIVKLSSFSNFIPYLGLSKILIPGLIIKNPPYFKK